MHRALRPFAAAVVLAALAACSTQPPPAAGTPTAEPPASTAATTAAAEGSVTYEVTGSGTALTVDYTPDAKGDVDHLASVPLPWTKKVPVVGSPTIYEVVVVGGDDVACRIRIGAKVVAQEPVGGSAHCIYQP